MAGSESKAASRRVGRYFTAGEFDTSDADHLPGLGALCAVFLDPMRARFGPATIHSGYRDAGRNRSVGGAKESRHLYDQVPLEAGADVTFAKGSPVQWAAFARLIAATVGRGRVGTYRTHVHVDLGPRRIW